MRGRRTLRIGLLFAAVAVGGLSAACLPPAPSGPASLAISPSPTVNFISSSQAAGFPMPSMVVTVTNTGGHTARNILVPGVDIYSVPQNHCSSLAPGQSCQATILFCPNQVKQYNDMLVVTGQDATSGAPLSASTMLMGTGTP